MSAMNSEAPGPLRAAQRSVHAADYVIGAALALAYVLLLVGTEPALAMSRDESFYVTAAEDYAGWFEQLYREPRAALEQAAVDRAWDYNNEHPPLAKSAFALSWLLDQHFDLFERDSLAHRFPAMLMSGALLFLIYLFGARVFGRQAGVFAAVSFALLPRVFYHAHLNAFDVPITLMITWTTYCYWRSLTRPRWAILTGIAFGMSLATKHNSWVLPGIFGIHFAWVAWNERSYRKAHPRLPARLSLVPRWLFSMLLIGPALFVAMWPWLWHDTLARFGQYAGFHLHHEYYNMAYFGVNYFQPPFPISYPFVMMAYTVPLTLLLLSALALLERARALVPRAWLARLWPRGSYQADRRATDVLLVGALLAPMVIIALPSTPIFGGTKHWFPSYPFLCLYAGYGYMRLARLLRPMIAPRLAARGLEGLAGTPMRLVFGAVLLAPSAIETMHSHPFGLSHYTYLAGGVPGAADHGMNRQFWGFTTGSVAPWLLTQMPEGGTVYVCDTTFQAVSMLHRDGVWPASIRPTPNLASADFVLVHHEHHFAEVEFQAWVAFGSLTPAHVLTYDGVPIVTIYENPRRRTQRRSARP
ncbi:MAG: glycosyltransferase family 39 protein [Sandaracinaceae bacterium]|nr:glycosyltransferase family 39 protein [Sandaracinaceae bacterium]